MADRFIVQKRNERWLVIDTEALPPKKRVRSSHATEALSQKYVDCYNNLNRERIRQTARARRAAENLRSDQPVD